MQKSTKLHRIPKIHLSRKIQHLFLGESKMSKDLALLLIVGGLFSMSVALSNTFVNIYIWKQQGDYLTIALYNLFIVLAQPFIFILAGRWAKQVDRVIVLRLGVFFLSIFFLTVLLMGDMASRYVILLGVLLGIGFGFYWLAFNVLTFEITEPDTRDIFNGFFGLLNSLAGMIGPFLAGWLITRMPETQGYTVIFAVSMVLFVLAVFLSFFIKRRSAKGRFRLKNVLRWRNISHSWRFMLLANTAQGLREGSFPFLITVWIFVATGTELALGTYALVTSGVSLVFYYLAGRFISAPRRKPMILMANVILALSVWVIVFDVNFTRLMVYGVIVSTVFPLLMVPFSSLSYDVIGQAKKAAEWRIEYVVSRELFLNGGRVFSILIFIVMIYMFRVDQAIPYYLVIFSHTQFLVYWFIRKVTLY